MARYLGNWTWELEEKDMENLKKSLGWLAPIILPIAAGTWQPFPGGPWDWRNLCLMIVAGVVGTWLGFNIHPNGFRGPSIGTPPSQSGYVKILFLLLLMIASLLACAAISKGIGAIAGEWIGIGRYQCRISGVLSSIVTAQPNVGIECKPSEGVQALSATGETLPPPACSVTMIQ